MLDPIAFMQAAQITAREARSARPTRPSGQQPRRRRKP
jgi:hypothetical protein